MEDTPVYYFDVLPLHFCPEPLESFTSYLTRLAEANGIQNIGQFASLCFSEQGLVNAKSFKDYPLASFGTLESAANCPESIVAATTFYHLARKFGRAREARLVPSFLHGSIAKSLRYCPTCLQERGYYSLLWRFSSLEGCSLHACHLLDKCGYCGREIPIFSSPLKMARCPFCRGNLGACLSQSLDGEEQRETRVCSRDFEFLLSPQPWETIAENLSLSIGQQYTLLREAKGLAVQEMSQQSAIPEQKIEEVEFRYPELVVVTFQSYLEYAKFLGVGFRDIFCRVLLQSGESEAARDDAPSLSEDAMIERVLQAAQQLNDLGKPVTKRAILRITRFAHNRLKKHPRVRTLLEEVVERARCDREKEKEQSKEKMIASVQEAVHLLEAWGHPVTWQEVSEMTGLPSFRLRTIPRIIALLNQPSPEYLRLLERQERQQEDALLAEVKTVISQLEQLGKPVTQVAVYKITGRKREEFIQYPRVLAVLRQAGDTYRQHQKKKREDELVAEAEMIIEQLEALGEPLTRFNVCRKMGIADSGYYYNYPGLVAYVKRRVAEAKRWRRLM